MLLPAWIALLLLPLAKTDASYDERDFACELGDVRIPTTSVCDGVLDCERDADTAGDGDRDDESEKICAPESYLTSDLSLVAREVTNTSLVLSWSEATAKVSNYSLELAGYFVTGRSEPHSFQNTVPRRLRAYRLQWLKPWTQYTLIMRPFYTDTGKPHSSYKIGRAASVTVTTLPTAPEVPSLVSVLSAQQRNVVLNIVGPSFWNSDAVAFHVRWEPTSQGRGLRGELDVSLDADWSPEENTINATLPLQGGWDYQVFVSAVGAGTSGTTLKGPELEVEVSVPLDSYEIAAYNIRPTTAVLSWRSAEPADVFKVTVKGNKTGFPYLDIKTFEVDGTEKVNSWHSILITGLRPWTYYEATLEGCSADDCSESVSTAFATQPDRIPQPTVTRVEATSSRSLELAWRFPQEDSRFYGGFRVQLCTDEHASGTCFVAHTKEKKFTAQELTPETKYFIWVSAQLRNPFGALELGPSATASVETWGDVPALTVSHKEKIDDGLGTHLVAWTCVNSSVSRLEYRLREDDDWTTCDESADCDVTWNRRRTVSLTSGYLRFTHYQQSHLNVYIRGCNGHGCGREKNVDFSAGGILTPPVMTVTRQGHSASFRCDNLPNEMGRGVEILWKCGGVEDMHRKQSIQRFDHHGYERQYYCEKEVPGFPEETEDCEISAAYYERSGGITYYGPRAQVTPAMRWHEEML